MSEQKAPIISNWASGSLAQASSSVPLTRTCLKLFFIFEQRPEAHLVIALPKIWSQLFSKGAQTSFRSKFKNQYLDIKCANCYWSITASRFFQRGDKYIVLFMILYSHSHFIYIYFLLAQFWCSLACSGFTSGSDLRDHSRQDLGSQKGCWG